MALEIKNLNFSFESKKIFENFQFFLEDSQILKLTGSNGCGKTTLLELICGLKKMDSGSISLLGGEKKNQLSLPKECLYLSTDFNGLFLSLSAFENIAFWCRLSKIDNYEPLVHKELEKWGFLKSYLKHHLPVQRFSTGMKRRLALLRSFIFEKHLLLLDEPTNGLDLQGVQIFYNSLEEHRNKNHMAIITTHDPYLLKELSHQTLSLEN